MRSQISYTVLALALVAAASSANAQTISDQPGAAVVTVPPSGTLITQEPLLSAQAETVVAQPVRTVRTVETVRTVRPAQGRAHSTVRRQVVTTTRQTILRQRVAPAQTVVAPVVAATYSQPLYDEYSQPLYDTVVPAQPPAVGATAVDDRTVVAPPVYGMPVVNPIPIYRYVYQLDRILVIDPNTNIAIQAIPR